MNEERISTFILRFRDLGALSPGQTIAYHSEIVERKRHVYWGWWAKSGEKVPSDAFIRLSNLAKNGPLPCFLFDSGQQDALYQVQCSDIVWKNDLEPRPTPDAEATPDYYSERELPAWFKFVTAPVRVESSTLQRWSYVEIDEFFSSGESPYGSFDGKQVSSPRELLNQNRTIWFVRPFDEGRDKTHEILLTDLRRLEPRDFSNNFRTSKGDSLLWLSDLHFSTGGNHGFPVEPEGEGRPVALAIEDCLDSRGLKARISGLLASGDFTWKADAAEYDQSAKCLQDLLDCLGNGREGAKGLSAENLLVCPGNHDLVFSETPSEPGAEVKSVIGDPSVAQEYRRFYRRFFYKNPNRFLSSGRKFLLGGSVPVEIAAVNSCFLEQKQGLFQGHGFVGAEQLKKTAAQMGWNGPPKDSLPLRMLMLHHHLLPVTYRDIGTVGGNYSVTLDAEAVVRWIVDNGVRIVLHGHMHQPFCAKLSRYPQQGSLLDCDKPPHDVWILGMGSTGVGPHHLGEMRKNVFGVLRYQTSAVEYRLFSVDPVNQSEALWTIRLPL